MVNKPVSTLFLLLLLTWIGIYLYNQHDDPALVKITLSGLKKQADLNPRETLKSEKWIVITTVAKPTDDVIYMSKLPGWRVVVVGDKKTPNNWTNRNCEYLSLKRQKEIGFQITSMIPENSYSRKNIGYLFAVANGAKVIYETDDDNRPFDKLQQFTFSSETTGLMYNGFKTFNPYRHFGQSSTWPRGYPLSSIGENFSNAYVLGKWRSPLIQQGIVNGDPDVDAIFRLSRKLTSKSLNITFSGRSPPVFVLSGTYAPFNAQNTLFFYDAFWALFLPSTTTTRVCDIWRGYWAQRLLWEIGANVGFYPPNAFSRRNPHLYINDFMVEQDLYFKTEGLLELLQSWTCNIKYSFFDCAKYLMSKMVDHGYLKNVDAILIRLWINDLQSLHYIEPKRIYFNKTNGEKRLKIKHYINKNVIFKSQEEAPPLISQSKYNSFTDLPIQLLEKCPHLDFTKISLSLGTLFKKYENILLVVPFNFPFYENIKTIEILYRYQFPYIVYCGKNIELFKNKTRKLTKQVSFIEIDTHEGYFAQKCLIQAMQMNYKVVGYLFMMDDVLLNTNRLTNLSTTKIWIYKPWKPFSESGNSPDQWFKTKYGLRAYQKCLQELYKTDAIAHGNFKRLLIQNTRIKDGFYKGWSDIVFIPSRYSRQFLFYMEIFAKNEVFLEYAIPTVLAAIERKENWIFLNGTYLWGYNRDRQDRYDDFFKGNEVFVHPLKLYKLLTTQKGRVLFCKKIIPSIYFND